MRTVPAALNTHYALETTTVATLWKVTRVDGQVFGFTDHDQDLTVSGVAYESSTGYSASAARTTLGLEVDNAEVAGALDSLSITEADIRAGLWDYAVVEMYRVNWASVADGVEQIGKGFLGTARTARNRFVIDLNGFGGVLRQSVGRVILAACDADLYDTRCAVNPASFTVTGTITGVTSKRVFADTSRSEANGYFDHGKITWTAGLNNGLSAEVKTYLLSGGALTLQLSMPFTVAVGDTYSMQAGCDKLPTTCITKFSNIVNFRGDRFVPGPDEILQYPDAH